MDKIKLEEIMEVQAKVLANMEWAKQMYAVITDSIKELPKQLGVQIFQGRDWEIVVSSMGVACFSYAFNGVGMNVIRFDGGMNFSPRLHCLYLRPDEPELRKRVLQELARCIQAGSTHRENPPVPAIDQLEEFSKKTREYLKLDFDL